jgi:hypothetical protein
MWINRNHSIVRYSWQPCENPYGVPQRAKFMKFHVFVLLASIGVRRKNARMNFVSIHGHWTLKRPKPCNSLEVRNIMFDPNEKVECGIGGE